MQIRIISQTKIITSISTCKKIAQFIHSFIRTKKILSELLIFMNLYHHAKNQAISSICFGGVIDLKILQSDWLRAFLPIFPGC